MAYLSRNESKPNPNITLNFKPTSVGTMRLLFQFQASIKMLHELGLSEDETDQVVLNNLCFSVSRFFSDCDSFHHPHLKPLNMRHF